MPVKARYLKLINYQVPGGTFAVSGFRVFGSGSGDRPGKVNSFEVLRDPIDGRNVKLTWKKQPGATGYNIRFGILKDDLNRVYQVYGDTSLIIRSLTKDQA